MLPTMEQRLVRPPDLVTWEIALRSQTDADAQFLKDLYASVRLPELAVTGWPDAFKHAFLERQLAMQSLHYTSHYAGLWRGIILHADIPVGRLYLWRNSNDIRIVDLSLLASFRGKGIGTGLLRAVLDEAARTAASTSLHVQIGNPARNLYLRLGFRPEGEATPPYVLMVHRRNPLGDPLM